MVDEAAEVAEGLADAVAASAHHALQITLEGKHVSAEYTAAARQLVREYDSEQHVGLGDGSVNRLLVDRLGLTEYLTERFAIAGSPELWAVRVEQLRESETVDGVHLHPVHDDPLEFIERMDEELIPAP